ncbi:MAG: DUF1501 domain-containing protein [Myxococcales bacterium]|nr:DUF1501 domain-containing protein [Myxococcales bacterium]
MISLPRRTFLKAAAGFAGASLFGGLSFRAFAQASNLAPADRCFVFAYFGGGWDVLLSLDPRDPAAFTAERISETRILPGYSLLSQDPTFPTAMVTPTERAGAGPSNILFGPAIGRMADHYDLMTVVRGLNMSTVAHEVGFRYFLTGKEPNGSAARGSSTATEIVGQLKPNVPVPNIAYNIETYNDRYPGYANALRVSSANDLLVTLSPSPTAIDSEIEKQLIDLRGRPVTCEADLYDSRGLVKQYNDARAQMKTVLDAQLDRNFRFEDNATDPPELRAEKAALRTRFGLRPEGTQDARNSAAARAAMVAVALRKGVSQCVSINITGGLDTHFGSQVTQATNQRLGWNALADLVTDLRSTPHPAGGHFMDHTTVLIFSEFSRTPLINAAGGRDHHITNSCMLLGAGLKHNFVFGRSGDVGLSAGVIDHDTGLPSPDGFQVLPDHIIATVLASAGLDYSITRVAPLKGLLAG